MKVIDKREKVKKEKTTYRRGDWFMCDGNLYQLIQETDPAKMILCCNGWRKNNGITVSDPLAVSIREMNKISIGKEFQKVNVEIHIVSDAE